MDRDETAENRFDAGVFETRLADHAFEAGHVGEAADRFDEIAIAVLVIGNRLADLRHQLVRIEVVGFLEAGPFDSAEFEAEEAPAIFQHAMRFLQRPVDMRDIPDPERNRVGIEDTARKAQFLGILARPYQPVDPTLHRALDPDIEHVLVDVRDSYARALFGHTESDVAGTARHVENGFARLRFDAFDEAVLPQAVHAHAHRVVHHVVFGGDIGKNLAHAAGLFRSIDIFVAEGNGFAHAGALGGIAAAAKALN